MIPVTKTYLPDINQYKDYIDKIYETGWLTNNGDLVRKLELKLKEYLGVKNIVLVSNGTVALNIAYKLLGLENEVITTPFSFVATTSSMVWQGLKPVFVDINKNDYNIDANRIEKKITEYTTGIVPVHVFGNACDVEQIEEIAKKHNLKVIYDASHCFGVKYKSKSILNYGDISTISFHSTKLFHTIEGGALIINNDELYEKAKRMINFGFCANGYIEEIGINAKMNEFQAAMGLCVLSDIDKISSRRKEKYEYYIKKLENIDLISFQELNKSSHINYSYLPIVFKDSETMLTTLKNMNNEDIFPRRYFYPSLNKLNYIHCNEVMPNSEDISERILCLPLYDSLKNMDIDKIVEIIKRSSIYSIRKSRCISMEV
ncbi:DegT/DnrJ/EryC1/StrS family aminotransferase [Terrisporobacter mayombei]|uniref:dTDP-4-amino-4,6-dideoxy-D-glucose transaminase n=1 Tax=Terrisporobacter mayombei TaxID=1541 RepID=A0ABY9Q6D4_9FIRM|nr:DegT/DnrJ/EryC1/StrS family aminotransferase [Terrisporobacter mayombei]MCC3869507.1 DegT/DnrJ/EryC1/StrS family aminotransferase [Terrisporobacter mayombei]WMT83556.1 dTDP-4-amino-4,6-dideoxy-D-glucose transaminase [Terrisporobacter mayombei]